MNITHAWLQYIIALKHESDGVQLNRIVQNISLEIWYKHA